MELNFEQTILAAPHGWVYVEMDFKAKPKDKGANEECLVLHSLKMLPIYDMNSGVLDGRKKMFQFTIISNDTTKVKHKKTGKFLVILFKNNEIVGH